MANNRIFYAIQQLGFEGITTGGGYQAAFGVQSVGMTTNFNLTQVFEYGQIAIYENIEGIPDVEITASKVLDGQPLLYHLATVDAGPSPTLSGRSSAKCKVAMSIFDDTADNVAGAALQIVEHSGMFVSSLNYSFTVDDIFAENVTLVGNDRLWKLDSNVVNPIATGRQNSMSFPGDGEFANNDHTPIGVGGVNRKENLIMSGVSPDYCLIPLDVFGTQVNGINNLNDSNRARISSITVSADLGREEINELGRRSPFTRYVTFPLEVTSQFEVTSHSGDLVSATEEGILTTGSTTCDDLGNLSDRTIRLATCEGTRIYLGTKNKLSSVNYGGGDAGGGNVTATYAYTTFNDFTVVHSGDPNSSGAAWWIARSAYLT